jgi:predicted alpha/beta hydrolase
MECMTLDVQGHPVALREYPPESTARARAAIVLGGAMGVRQSFYEPFARWVARQGYLVVSFDYRGSGDSLPAGQSLRDVPADLFDWARDYDAVIDHSHARLQVLAPGAPLFLLGHSLGAQLPGLLHSKSRIDGLLSVAAGSGYWRENAPRLRRVVPYFWWVLVPLAIGLCGYFPGRRLRKVGDLPAGVMRQWRRWCLHPRYSVGAEGPLAAESYAEARFPVLAWSITDDELMTLRGTQSLLALYENAPRAVESVAPIEARARRIGHFGFFREQFSGSLWPRALEALERLPTLRVAERTA